MADIKKHEPQDIPIPSTTPPPPYRHIPPERDSGKHEKAPTDNKVPAHTDKERGQGQGQDKTSLIGVALRPTHQPLPAQVSLPLPLPPHPPPPPPPRPAPWPELLQPEAKRPPPLPARTGSKPKLKKNPPLIPALLPLPPSPALSAQTEPVPVQTSPPTPPPLPPAWPQLPHWIRRSKMAAPPRMLILSGGGYEAFVAMPPSYDKAVQLAMEKFNIPKDTHLVRLSCKASEMQWIGGCAGTEDIFIADNDSFHYACAGKHVARLGVHVYDKNAKPAAPPTPATAGKAASNGGGDKTEEKKESKPPPPPPTADQSLTCSTTAGKNVTLAAKVTGELAKGPPAGNYLGTLTIEDKSWKQTFVGNQLGPNEVMTKYVVHDKNTARLLFRPRSVRPSVEFLHPEEQSLEVSLSIVDWTVTAAYPMTSLIPDGGRQRLRWFLKVQPGGIVEDMLTGTMSNGLFVEMLPSVKAKPDKAPDPQDPLIPAYPDIRPSNAWCLPQSIFIPHMDRVLTALGLPVESRTAMITAWLPGVTRHKNIAYRILNRSQLDPTSALTIIPPPSVMVRIFVLFKGIPDSELKDWENAGILHAEMGLDWRESVGWTPDLQNEELFRVIEYGAMEVFD